MEGENNLSTQRSKERPPADGKANNRGEPESGSKDRNRNRRSGPGGSTGGNRKGIYRFEDQLEHAICQRVTHQVPRAYPVIGRPEIATMPQAEVARTGSSILLCDQQHDGPHLWPNGDEAL